MWAHATRPSPARAALAGNLQTTESLPVETQPVQQCWGGGGATRAARAQTPRHLQCKYAQPGPAGFPTVSGPSPVTRGKETPLALQCPGRTGI